MKGQFWLSDEQWALIKPHLPYCAAGRRREDDRRVLSGILFCLRRGYRLPAEYGPAKTLYNRYRRWSGAGVLERVFETLAREHADLSTPMIDAGHVKTHRIAANGVKKHRRRPRHRQDQRRAELEAAPGV